MFALYLSATETLHWKVGGYVFAENRSLYLPQWILEAQHRQLPPEANITAANVVKISFHSYVIIFWGRCNIKINEPKQP